jgi:FMN phosphatase YigB (HAD superfamily)
MMGNNKLKDIKKNRLIIFDLDDCLVKTDAKIKIINPSTRKIIKELTPEEFNYFTNHNDYVLNFDDFESPEILRQGKFIHEIFGKLKRYYSDGVPVAILTARSSSELVRGFFLENGIDIHPDLVIAINDPMYDYEGTIAEMKKQAIIDFIDDGYTDLVFFDDNEDNLRLAKQVTGYKNANIEIIQVG